ncbi:hypothetical protein VFPFJ_10942 [Purpureocillium lilacinum]|uniref:Uncharacterized protein n=1 Tax=Purpureocillium lilacinum TaxID=33203 RepID=A0A179FE57_PURLI|nr:hypothetical protein VFPFJ_11375 [Purpureocillium lilacinum]XP_018173404.1 hypothetical protein VFPFJ_10942 [Purpureocillium lilacinum]OAQ59787.1 hypothetical protein VFPBJ_11583 [Purpureocillium lilacinum]OAQ63776.1 hypothetical protein VFPFJ_11375 [Purpureocillium lilacinum]OAQ74396.1 hypothetical protein VFPFJ_10942 [Purpureocillium lilacinum]
MSTRPGLELIHIGMKERRLCNSSPAPTSKPAVARAPEPPYSNCQGVKLLGKWHS